MATYDKSVDYSALIAQEAAKGVNANRQLLAQYEAQRNAKITGERLPYAQTAIYTSELGRPLGYREAVDRSDYINEIYDSARERAVAALTAAYERETAGFDYAASLVPGQYRAARNALAGEAALTRQSVNEQFAASGLNTGAAGQARLSLAVASQNAFAALGREEAETLGAIELERSRAEAEYRSAVAEAIAASELERAQALYDEAVRVDESYRAYSEELLAAWGLTLAGTPIAGEAPAYSGGGRGSARKERSEPEPEERRDEYELLRDQLSRIPGLTGMNRAALVRDWYDAGRLSYQSMQRLLAEIG